MVGEGSLGSPRAEGSERPEALSLSAPVETSVRQARQAAPGLFFTLVDCAFRAAEWERLDCFLARKRPAPWRYDP